LWIEHDADEPRAQAVLEELRRPPSGPAWVCPGCGESIEPQFGACWNCGAGRPD
jgi:rubrerythrin